MADELDNFFDDLNEDDNEDTKQSVQQSQVEDLDDFNWDTPENDKPQDIDWGTPENNNQSQDVDWGTSENNTSSQAVASTSDSDDGWLDESDDKSNNDFDWSGFDDDTTSSNQTQTNTNNKNNEWQADVPLEEDEATEEFKKKFNVNYKQASLIIAGICILVALLFLGISKIHINTGNVNANQQNIQKEANKISQEQTSTNKELKYVPDNTSIQYNSDVITSSGTVKEKSRYLMGNQLIYDIIVEIPTGTATESMHYYCGKDAYDKVSKGTTVTVEYQVADNNYYSIKSIKTN